MEMNIPTSSSSSSSSRQPTGFFESPLELRLQIYRYCLVCSDPVELDLFPCPSPDRQIPAENKSLLLVSKKVGLEALDVLYGDNVFQVAMNGRSVTNLQLYFTEANRQRIRIMQVLLLPEGGGYRRGWDSTIFSPILAHLKKLSIVVKQPEQSWVRKNLPISEKYIQVLIGSHKLVLKYIASQLPQSCIVEVDGDDVRETSTLMKECFPSGYRKVQTMAGGLCESIHWPL